MSLVVAHCRASRHVQVYPVPLLSIEAVIDIVRSEVTTASW